MRRIGYAPSFGTFPEAAIAYLRTLAHGAQISASVLADEIGAAPEAMHTHTRRAVAAGLLVRRVVGRVCFYALPGRSVDLDGEAA